MCVYVAQKASFQGNYNWEVNSMIYDEKIQQANRQNKSISMISILKGNRIKYKSSNGIPQVHPILSLTIFLLFYPDKFQQIW